MKNKISEEEKKSFIDDCLLYFEDDGKDDFINVVIDNHDEVVLNIKDAMLLLIDFFLLENPDITLLREINMEEFYLYIYGDYWDDGKDKDGPLLVIIRNGTKVN